MTGSKAMWRGGAEKAGNLSRTILGKISEATEDLMMGYEEGTDKWRREIWYGPGLPLYLWFIWHRGQGGSSDYARGESQAGSQAACWLWGAPTEVIPLGHLLEALGKAHSCCGPNPDGPRRPLIRLNSSPSLLDCFPVKIHENPYFSPA